MINMVFLVLEVNLKKKKKPKKLNIIIPVWEATYIFALHEEQLIYI